MFRFLAAAACAAALAHPCAADATTYSVSTPAALTVAVKSARGGDIIRLLPGNYGAFEFRNVNPSYTVTIQSANPALPPVFSKIVVRDSSQLALSGLTISAPTPTSAAPALTAADIFRSHNVRMSDMTIHGVLGGGVSNEPLGVRISGSSFVTIANSSFTELSHAITADASSRLTITDNAFSGIRIDGIMADGASSSTIARNRFSDFRPEAGDHPDAIQIFNSTTPTTNLLIRDNLMIGSADGQMQGVFMTNVSGDRSQLTNINVTGNLMWGTMWNGIAAFDAGRVTISGNALYSIGTLAASKTWVRLSDVDAAAVSRNIAGGYVYSSVGRLANSVNATLFADAGALAAIASWDATHLAAIHSLAFGDDAGLQLAPSSSRSLTRQSLVAAVAGVPEPASWLSLIAGFMVIGTGRRRLQRRAGQRMARG